jgi:hypothetical protein
MKKKRIYQVLLPLNIARNFTKVISKIGCNINRNRLHFQLPKIKNNLFREHMRYSEYSTCKAGFVNLFQY